MWRVEKEKNEYAAFGWIVSEWINNTQTVSRTPTSGKGFSKKV